MQAMLRVDSQPCAAVYSIDSETGGCEGGCGSGGGSEGDMGTVGGSAGGEEGD